MAKPNKPANGSTAEVEIADAELEAIRPPQLDPAVQRQITADS